MSRSLTYGPLFSFATIPSKFELANSLKQTLAMLLDVIHVHQRFYFRDVAEEPRSSDFLSSPCSRRRSVPVSNSRSKAANEGSSRWNSKFLN